MTFDWRGSPGRGWVLLLLLLPLSACVTTDIVSIRYLPAAAPSPAGPTDAPLAVGKFTDVRGGDPQWLGAVRSGFGDPIQKLKNDKPVDAMVALAFTDALRMRNRLADPAQAALGIEGEVEKLDCTQFMMHREARLRLAIRIIDLKTQETLLEKTYTGGKNETNFGNASTAALYVLTQKALGEAIDQVLADAEFTKAASRADAHAATAAARVPGKADVAGRLSELKALRDKGLITREQYEKKRQEILDSM
jgi:hypothetical protein